MNAPRFALLFVISRWECPSMRMQPYVLSPGEVLFPEETRFGNKSKVQICVHRTLKRSLHRILVPEMESSTATQNFCIHIETAALNCVTDFRHLSQKETLVKLFDRMGSWVILVCLVSLTSNRCNSFFTLELPTRLKHKISIRRIEAKGTERFYNTTEYANFYIKFLLFPIYIKFCLKFYKFLTKILNWS